MTTGTKTPHPFARGAVALLALGLASCGGKDVRPGDENPDDPAVADACATDVPSTDPASGACAPVRLQCAKDLNGFKTDRYVWRDGDCRVRSVSLVRNDAADPAGWNGGYIRRYTYEAAGAQRTCDGQSAQVPGWGMVTSHLKDGQTWGAWTQDARGTGRILFKGAHHALHELKWPLSLDGNVVQVTVQYLFATGRDHPLYAITHDSSGFPADRIEADVRSPYGDLAFDDNANTDIAGLGWGDRYRFVTLNSPVTMNSGWDYREPNVVPYTRMWTAAPDAEMGVVQTQTWQQKPAGGYWLYPEWGTRHAAGPMPVDYNWAYQLNQYELPSVTNSHRLAWGSNFGAVGKTQYPRIGDDGVLSGYPYQSYSVFMVLGTHASDPVLKLASQVEVWQGVKLSATEGTVRTRGPGGVGRTDAVTYDVPGYNPVYATWEADAASNRVALAFDTQGRTLVHPMVVVHGYTATSAPKTVTLNGQALTADTDYFASVDTAGKSVWLTLQRDVVGNTTLRVE
ncbi:hypothetical protein [Corallococcus terminator]|uniref:Lipoprotein n=1 Tax=Corallococcus terminator TaxID=2316733 RepID=A0A3A8HXY1_9BACT|nr:hypothetical protein [Corallococcus terminator]RKG75398.1 hypothetical protein D7V88_33605 [Corallococcus terminator]